MPSGSAKQKMGVSQQTFYRWKKKFRGMGVAEVRRLRVLEENRKLKQLVADLSPDKRMLREVMRKSPEGCSVAAQHRVSPDRLLRKRSPGPSVADSAQSLPPVPECGGLAGYNAYVSKRLSPGPVELWLTPHVHLPAAGGEDS